MAGPSVSVSIITYNQRDYIAKAIDSALAQVTDFDVTIHVGDDHSTDGTRDILKGYKERYGERIVLNLQPERPGGIPGRLNNVTTLRSCRGTYIAMLDGDDYWRDPDKLQRQVDFLEAHPGYAGAVHDCLELYQGEEVPRDLTRAARRLGRPVTAPFDIELTEVPDRAKAFQTSSFCFRRDWLPDFPDWFWDVYSADHALFLMLASRGPLRFDPYPASVQRIHAGSVKATTARETLLRATTEDAMTYMAAFPAIATPAFRCRHHFDRMLLSLGDGRHAAAVSRGARAFLADPVRMLRQSRAALRRRV